jgi:hypothetical protein
MAHNSRNSSIELAYDPVVETNNGHRVIDAI